MELRPTCKLVTAAEEETTGAALPATELPFPFKAPELGEELLGLLDTIVLKAALMGVEEATLATPTAGGVVGGGGTLFTTLLMVTLLLTDELEVTTLLLLLLLAFMTADG